MRAFQSLIQRRSSALTSLVATKRAAPTVLVGGTFATTRNIHASSIRSQQATPPVVETPHQWADPLVREYRYWNREETKERGRYSFLIEISPDSIQRESRIISLSAPDDPANVALHDGTLPVGAQLLGIGQSPDDFDSNAIPNTLFVSPSFPSASEQVPAMLKAYPSIEWVHVRSAGIDFVVSEELNAYRDSIQFTNAKVCFTSL